MSADDTTAEAVFFRAITAAEAAHAAHGAALRAVYEAARAEGEAAGAARERADVVAYLRAHRDVAERRGGQQVDAGPHPAVARWVRHEAVPDIEAGVHVGAAGGAPPTERPLGDHDARNVLWLAGRDLKQTNITSPAGKAAYERFERTPRVEVKGSFPRNGPARIDALVALIRECHEIHSEWHGRLISRAEAEAYVRGGAAGGGAR